MGKSKRDILINDTDGYYKYHIDEGIEHRMSWSYYSYYYDNEYDEYILPTGYELTYLDQKKYDKIKSREDKLLYLLGYKNTLENFIPKCDLDQDH